MKKLRQILEQKFLGARLDNETVSEIEHEVQTFIRNETDFAAVEPTVAGLVEHLRGALPVGVSLRAALQEMTMWVEANEPLYNTEGPAWACTAEEMIDRLRENMPAQFNTAPGSVIDCLLRTVGHSMFDQQEAIRSFLDPKPMQIREEEERRSLEKAMLFAERYRPMTQKKLRGVLPDLLTLDDVLGLKKDWLETITGQGVIVPFNEHQEARGSFDELELRVLALQQQGAEKYSKENWEAPPTEHINERCTALVPGVYDVEVSRVEGQPTRIDVELKVRPSEQAFQQEVKSYKSMDEIMRDFGSPLSETLSAAVGLMDMQLADKEIAMVPVERIKCDCGAASIGTTHADYCSTKAAK